MGKKNRPVRGGGGGLEIFHGQGLSGLSDFQQGQSVPGGGNFFKESLDFPSSVGIFLGGQIFDAQMRLNLGGAFGGHLGVLFFCMYLIYPIFFVLSVIWITFACDCDHIL